MDAKPEVKIEIKSSGYVIKQFRMSSDDLPGLSEFLSVHPEFLSGHPELLPGTPEHEELIRELKEKDMRELKEKWYYTGEGPIAVKMRALALEEAENDVEGKNIRIKMSIVEYTRRKIYEMLLQFELLTIEQIKTIMEDL